MATIFINYRREDSAGTTYALRQQLLKHFNEKELFMDIKGLERGVDFDGQLEKTVSLAQVMVVVIGREWLTVTDKQGNRRLFKDNDFVRSEIASALAQGIPMLPVLLEGAEMPGADDLPPDLQGLWRKNAATLRLDRMEDDAREIARTLKRLVKAQGTPWWMVPAAAALALMAGLALGPFVVNGLLGLGWGTGALTAQHAKALEATERERATAVSELDRVKTGAGQLRAKLRPFLIDELSIAEASLPDTRLDEVDKLIAFFRSLRKSYDSANQSYLATLEEKNALSALSRDQTTELEKNSNDLFVLCVWIDAFWDADKQPERVAPKIAAKCEGQGG